jgi:hypothetical protein
LAVKAAFRAASAYGGSVRLGIRPFEDHDEMATWLPEYRPYATPVWTVFKEGTLIGWDAGLYSEEEVAELLVRSLK